MHQDWTDGNHLFRSVQNNKLLFVDSFQIAAVPNSFAVFKDAVYIGMSIVHFLVNLRIRRDSTTQIGEMVDNFSLVWSITILDL